MFILLFLLFLRAHVLQSILICVTRHVSRAWPFGSAQLRQIWMKAFAARTYSYTRTRAMYSHSCLRVSRVDRVSESARLQVASLNGLPLPLPLQKESLRRPRQRTCFRRLKSRSLRCEMRRRSITRSCRWPLQVTNMTQEEESSRLTIDSRVVNWWTPDLVVRRSPISGTAIHQIASHHN